MSGGLVGRWGTEMCRDKRRPDGLPNARHRPLHTPLSPLHRASPSPPTHAPDSPTHMPNTLRLISDVDTVKLVQDAFDREDENDEFEWGEVQQ